MLKKLLDLQKNSYSPYSKFKVAAIILTQKGKEYKGVNVESSTFSPTICAERSAVASAISNGEISGSLKEIHLIGGDATQLVSPCGVCRQVLIEHMTKNGNVFQYTKDKVIKNTIEELLPGAFTKSNLEFK